jgi:hypothetical protein
VERKACRTPHNSVESLKASVNEVWADMSEDFVVKVCASFRPRIAAMVEAGGEHFEI